MEWNNNNKMKLEDMIYKLRDPDTTEPEKIELLADILVEGFLYQEEQKGNHSQEKEI